MKKLRKLLQIMLFINCISSIYSEMRIKDVIAVLINGIIVLVLLCIEKENK